jgi:hypothetical protein
METNHFLDKVSTSISVSMKTKNDLKNRKGSMSYEEYLRTLIRNQEKNKISAINRNTIIHSKFNRINGIYKIDDFSIIFAYNKYLDIPNFRFDIELKTIRQKGKIISFEEYVQNSDSFQDYFKILEKIIQKEIEPMFNFKKYGREDYKDYAAWERHFNNLQISTTSFEEDVLDKLNNQHNEESPYA